MANKRVSRTYRVRAVPALSLPDRPAKYRWPVLLCVLTPWLTFTAQAQNTDSDAGSDVPATGAETSEAEGASTSESSESQSGESGTPVAVEEENLYARPSPFGFGEVSYVPGFSGCASPGPRYSAATSQGVYSTLTPPASPAREAGRFYQLTLGASETYTDNLTLESDDEAMSEYITEISPRLDVCAATDRIQGELSYQIQGLFYANNSDFNDVYNNVSGDTTISIVPGRLYLGADTTYGQAVVDPSVGYSDSNLLRPGNQTSAWTSNISPYYIQPLGFLGTSTWRYRYGRTVYGNSDIPESSVNGAYFNLTSPDRFDTWSWQANAFTQRVRRSGGDEASYFAGQRNNNRGDDDPFLSETAVDESEFENRDSSRVSYFDKATLQFGYRLTQSLELLALGGLEDEYKADGTNDRLSSPLWNVGFRWTSPTNSLEARVGHRFFGTSYYINATHTGRTYDASINYREEPSTQGLNSLNGNATARNTSFSSPTTSLFDRGVFVQKELSVAVDIDTSALTQTRLRAYRQTREYIESEGRDERFIGGNVEIEYQFLPRMSLIPRANWERRSWDDSGFETDTAEAGISLIRTLTPTLRGGVSYGHAWRDANNEESDYDENRVSVSVLKSF